MTKTVLIFHPDLELSLVHFQKELTGNLNKSLAAAPSSNSSDARFFYAPLPLWLELNHKDFFCENKSQLKKLAANIKNVSLLENLKTNENSVCLTAKITLHNPQTTLRPKPQIQPQLQAHTYAQSTPQAERQSQTQPAQQTQLHPSATENLEYYFDLPISILHKDTVLPEKSLEIIKNTKNLLKNVKIFRLGICRQLSANSKEIEDFVWAKKKLLIPFSRN